MNEQATQTPPDPVSREILVNPAANAADNAEREALRARIAELEALLSAQIKQVELLNGLLQTATLSLRMIQEATLLAFSALEGVR